MSAALVLGGWTPYPKTLSQFRNPEIGILVLGALFYILRITRGFFKGDLAPFEWGELDAQFLFRWMWVFFGAAFLKAAWLDYASFHSSALDASMYDYAMMNTLRGRFMVAATGVDHFGIHATPVLFLLLPFHWIFHSALFSIFLHPLLLLAGAILFEICLKRRGMNDFWRVGIIFSYLSATWVSLTLHYGFHVEVFYPIFIFLIDLSLHPLKLNKRYSWIPFWSATLLFLSIKEDAPFHLVALLAAYWICRKISFQRMVIGCVVSACIAVLYLKVIIPNHAGGGTYHFVGAASGAGSTLGEAVLYLIAHPLYFFSRYLTGGWWTFVLPSLGVLLFSPFFWIASLPLLGLYSLAGDSQMFHLTVYYSIPLVPIFFLGMAEGFERAKRISPLLPLVAMFALVFTGSGYLIFRRTDLQKFVQTESALKSIPSDAVVCAPASVFPHLPYGEARLIDRKCLESAEFAIIPVEREGLSLYPYDEKYFSTLKKSLIYWKKLDELSGDVIEVYQKPDSSVKI